MGKPAARLGDLTAHGGAVTSGNPTVLVGGQPAATMGDLHVCPLCSPGPHVGGPVLLGAPTVLIGGRPAARVGDQCVCAAPAPDVIVSGCPTVLIGAASGAGGAAATAAAASAAGAAPRPGTPGTGTTARPLSPWVGVGYADAAGRPVAGWAYHAEGGADERDGAVGTGGQVWCDGLAEGGAVDVGLVGVYGCRWERGEARVGDPVGMSARCAGVADGELAHFEVWRETQGAGGAVEREQVWEVMGEVRGGRVEAARPFVFAWPEAEAKGGHEASVSPLGDSAPPALVDGDSAPGYSDPGGRTLSSAPIYVTDVTVAGRWRAKGGKLTYQDWVEVRLLDESDRPRRDVEVTFYLSNGESRQERTDGRGVARIDGVPPGHCEVEFPPAPAPR